MGKVPVLSDDSESLDNASLGSTDGSNEGTLSTEREHWDGSEALHKDMMKASRGNVSPSKPEQFASIS